MIFFGVFLLIFARGFIDGLEYGTERTQIDTNCAHLRIWPTGVDDNGFTLALEPRIQQTEDLLTKVPTAPGFVSATPRIRFSADVSDGRDQMPIIGIGVAADTDPDVFPLNVALDQLDGDVPGIIAGAGILTLFEKGVGDVLTLVARTPAGSISALDFMVRDVLHTGNPAVDNLQVLISLQDARVLLDLEETASTEIAIRLTSQRPTEEAAAFIRHQLPAFELLTWLEATEEIRSLMRIRRRALSVIVFVIMSIAAAGIANTILMSIYERFREIGTIAAFGVAPGSLQLLFLLEGIALGGLGSLAGVVFGGAAVLYFERVGIDLTSVLQGPDLVYPVTQVIYTEFTVPGLLASGALGLLVSALATVFPARRAALLDPVEALRS